MIEDGGAARVWYVVLCKSKSRHWALNWLDNGHVYAVRRSPAGTMWTVIEPTTSIVEATTIPVELMPLPQDYSEHSAKVIRYVARPEMGAKFKIRFGLLSCVTIVKALLGISKWRILSPDQLGDYLIKTGGVEQWRSNGTKHIARR